MADPTPASQNPAQGLNVPEDLQKKYPQLIELIKGDKTSGLKVPAFFSRKKGGP